MGVDKQMEIQSLELTNFRGIAHANLTLDGSRRLFMALMAWENQLFCRHVVSYSSEY